MHRGMYEGIWLKVSVMQKRMQCANPSGSESVNEQDELFNETRHRLFDHTELHPLNAT